MIPSVSSWSTAELEAFLRRHAGKDEGGSSHEDPPAPEPGQRKRADTLFIAGALTQQILTYQSRLQRVFDRGVMKLALLAEEGAGLARADAVLGAVETGMLGLAPAAYRRAFALGADFAAGFLGDSQLTATQADAILTAALAKNATFVSGSLLKDLRGKYTSIVTTDALAGPAAFKAVDALSETMSSRVGMYALTLWGVGHTGFAEEMKVAEVLLEWVVTSDNPCPDCPRLERAGPYGPDNPLPTFPGGGDTQCLSNCLCLLREYTGKGKGAGDASVIVDMTPVRKALDAIQAAWAQERAGWDSAMTAMAAQRAEDLERAAQAMKNAITMREKEHVDNTAALSAHFAQVVTLLNGRTDLTVEKMDAMLTKQSELNMALVDAIKQIEPPRVEISVPGPKRTTKRVKRDKAGLAESVVETHEYEEGS
jgi:hypothetical protein